MDHRLKKNSQFSYIYKKGERVSTNAFTLFVVKSHFENYKIGFSINKKLGKANVRNKLKRRLKAISKKLDIPPFHNYVVLAKENVVSLNFAELQSEMKKLFDKYEKRS